MTNGAALLGAQLSLRCRARAATMAASCLEPWSPDTCIAYTAKPIPSCASCTSHATFGATFAADIFGDLRHGRSMERRGVVVALLYWTRELHYWWIKLQQRAHGAGWHVHAFPHGLVWRRLARRHMDSPRMDLQQLHSAWLICERELRCDGNAGVAATSTQAATAKPRTFCAPLASRNTSCAPFAAQCPLAAHPATSATSVAARATSLPFLGPPILTAHWRGRHNTSVLRLERVQCVVVVVLPWRTDPERARRDDRRGVRGGLPGNAWLHRL